MYQTGGLFHPLLSQRIYQSNQGLKLSAKAFGLPKGVFICLKSRRLSNGSKVDMKQKQSCFLSGGGPGSRGPCWSVRPSSAPHPLSFLLSSSGCACQAPISKAAPASPLDFSWQAPPNARALPVRADRLTLTQEGGPQETQRAGADRRLDGGNRAPVVATPLWQAGMFNFNGHFRCRVPWTQAAALQDRRRLSPSWPWGEPRLGRPACNSVIGSSCATWPTEEAAAIRRDNKARPDIPSSCLPTRGSVRGRCSGHSFIYSTHIRVDHRVHAALSFRNFQFNGWHSFISVV